MNAWATLYRLGQPNTILISMQPKFEGADQVVLLAGRG